MLRSRHFTEYVPQDAPHLQPCIPVFTPRSYLPYHLYIMPLSMFKLYVRQHNPTSCGVFDFSSLFSSWSPLYYTLCYVCAMVSRILFMSYIHVKIGYIPSDNTKIRIGYNFGRRSCISAQNWMFVG